MPSMNENRSWRLESARTTIELNDVEIARRYGENLEHIPAPLLDDSKPEFNYQPVSNLKVDPIVYDGLLRLAGNPDGYLDCIKPICTEKEAVDFLKRKGYAVFKKTMETE